MYVKADGMNEWSRGGTNDYLTYSNFFSTAKIALIICCSMHLPLLILLNYQLGNRYSIPFKDFVLCGSTDS
jgi:hypothetical protein